MERIAIVGIGCRFPGGADDANGFWSLLCDGRSCLTEIPDDRWSLDGFWDPRPDIPNRSYSKWGGFLDDIRAFDAAYFGLSPREADAMDPQQRLLLMIASEAVFDAGLGLSELRRGKAGVFIGVSNVDYNLLHRYRIGQGDRHAGTGSVLSIVANRISNRLNLPGPSMGIDTACSSSLVAVDAACRYISDGSCDFAIAGGVNILLDPRMFITFSRAHMLSPTGRIRAFDASADGFVRGEGAGVVVLRRLDAALAAGDRIYAVIDATAVNQDGRTGALTEPNLEAQIAMMRAAAKQAGIAPDTIDYVEAHGTGTFVGDPIEANAIGTVFGGPRRERPLPIGSVKTNIGHLEPAAGIAGLIKTALVLHHRHIPASLGYEAPNPAIGFDTLGISVADKPIDLKSGTQPLCAMVNSFGFGGTNACALLSSASETRDGDTSTHAVRVTPTTDGPAPVAVPISAPTVVHLQRYAASLAASIERGDFDGHSLCAIAASLAEQVDHHEHRAVIIAKTLEELRERLVVLSEGREWPAADRHAPPEIITGRAKAPGTIVFTMTGQGGQWWSMGRELFVSNEVFRQSIEAFDRVFTKSSSWSVVEVLLADEADSNIHDAAITPAVMFAFQTGLADVWRARGVRPDIVLGHSFGEVTAAYLAGGIRAEAVARLVSERGLIRGDVDRFGAMAAIGLGADAIAPLLPSDGSIEIGGYNSPGMVTLTGEDAAIDALIERLNAEDPTILTRKLALDFAYHSSWFEPVEHIFKARVGKLETSPPELRVISTVTGALNDCFDADYWWRNLRYPVRYQQAVELALELGADTFIELGPHRTLSSMTAACALGTGRTVTTVSTLDKRWGDLVSVAVATGQLYVAGVEVDWSRVYGTVHRNIALPRQPWVLTEHWSEPEEAARIMRPTTVHELLGARQPGPAPHWSNEISLTSHAFLGDHRLDGECVFPAAGYVEMFTVAAREMLGSETLELVDVGFPAALFFGADEVVQLATNYDPQRRRLTIHSRMRDDAGDWQLRAQVSIFPLKTDAGTQRIEPVDLGRSIDVAEFYRTAEAAGYSWGIQFQGLQSIGVGNGEATGKIVLPCHSENATSPFALDPRGVDSALQLMLACNERAGADGIVPVAIERISVWGDLGNKGFATSTTRTDGNALHASVNILNGEGAPVAAFDGIKALPKRRKTARDGNSAEAPKFYGETFEPVELAPSDKIGTGTWVLIAGEDDTHIRHIGEAIRVRGGKVDIQCIRSRAEADEHAYLEVLRICFARMPMAGIVYSLPISRPPEPDIDIASTAERETLCATAFAKAISMFADENPLPSITVLTCGARAADAEVLHSDTGLAQSTLLGLFRTVATELPEATIKLIDLDNHDPSDANLVFNLLTSQTSETEIAIRSGKVYAARFGELAEHDKKTSRIPIAKLGQSQNFALKHSGPPGTEGLHWRQALGSDLGLDDVAVEVHSVGLNFRDIMAVSGLLSEEAEPTPAIDALGLELSGVVVGVGSNVDTLKPGCRVFGMGRGALQRRVTWPSSALKPTPRGLTHAEAATIPSAFLTAHYALNRVARLRPDESVLIHSATGGVGLAAIALARRAGARIIATAGSDEKREYLRGLGIDDVFNSRKLEFADQVMEATGGRGADVVLNSLGGDLLAKSLGCVAPYGRFLELGKRDVYANGTLDLKVLKSNVSFHVIDLAALIAERPALAGELLDEICSMISDGEIVPLPFQKFGATDVPQAFRLMSEAKHIGKIVIELDDPKLWIENALSDGAPLDRDGTYLVTGGTKGFGRAVGEWLVERGAGRVVLASRSAGSDDAKPSGGAIESIRLDVTDPDHVLHAVRSIERSDKPLRGIVHAAVVYDDAMLPDMTAERISRVLRPKIAGALNLSRAIEDSQAEIDFFLSFSSLAQNVGWTGQSNYAAANSFLEAHARWQRSRGIPGKCINWGALEESGHVARSTKMQSYLASAGWIGIDNETALVSMAKALDFDLAAMAIVSVDWKKLAAAHPAFARSPRTSGLSMAGQGGGAEGSAQQLLLLHGDVLETAVLQLVRNEAAKVLRVSAEDLVAIDTLAEAGIDSLSSFELRLRIEQQLRIEVPMNRYARTSSFRDLASLCQLLVDDARARTL